MRPPLTGDDVTLRGGCITRWHEKKRRRDGLSMNPNTEATLKSLSDEMGLDVHVMKSQSSGGLRGPLPGTFWIRYNSLTGSYRLSPKGAAWQTPVQQYLRQTLGEAPETGAGGYPRWYTHDPQVLRAAVKIMAEVQGVRPPRPKLMEPEMTSKEICKPCACGCGAVSKSGSWVPGHDSKYMAKVHARVKEVFGPDVNVTLLVGKLVLGACDAVERAGEG